MADDGDEDVALFDVSAAQADEDVAFFDVSAEQDAEQDADEDIASVPAAPVLADPVGLPAALTPDAALAVVEADGGAIVATTIFGKPSERTLAQHRALSKVMVTQKRCERFKRLAMSAQAKLDEEGSIVPTRFFSRRQRTSEERCG